MNKRTILLVVLLIAVLGGAYAWKEFNRGAAKADDLPVKETVTAQDLMTAFTTDESAATARFVGTAEQVVQVTGTIRAIDPAGKELTNIVLGTDNELAGVVCEFAPADVPADWRSGASVTVKGICTGMLMDVVLVRCTAME